VYHELRFLAVARRIGNIRLNSGLKIFRNNRNNLMTCLSYLSFFEFNQDMKSNHPMTAAAGVMP
jgi:hypothetical protein